MADDVKEAAEQDDQGGLDVMATVATGMEEFNIGLLNAFKSGVCIISMIHYCSDFVHIFMREALCCFDSFCVILVIILCGLFQIEQSLRLVQQMSEKERSVAINTLASLCGQANFNVVEAKQESVSRTDVSQDALNGQIIFKPDGVEEDDTALSKSDGPEKDFVAFVTEVNSVSIEMKGGSDEPAKESSPNVKTIRSSPRKASSSSKAKSILKVPTVKRRSQRRRAQQNKTKDNSEETLIDAEEREVPNAQLLEDGTENNEFPNDDISTDNIPGKEKIFKCQTCLKSFGTKYALNG